MEKDSESKWFNDEILKRVSFMETSILNKLYLLSTYFIRILFLYDFWDCLKFAPENA